MAHYEERLQADLGAVRARVMELGETVGDALKDATEAFLALDRRAASRLIVRDHLVNRAVRELDRMCHAFVARHVPSAGHLRFISSVMRMNVGLERIGDYATTISRETVQMKQPPPRRLAEDLATLSTLGRRVLEQALKAFNESNPDLARATTDLANQMEASLDTVFHDLLRLGERQGREVEDLFGLLVVLYRLERVGDQAKNICEETVFIVTGQTKRPKVYSILFVDEANDRWSQMAEAIARKAFPESGSYASAGWAPGDAVDPRVADWLDRNSYDLSQAAPARLKSDRANLVDTHVVIGLQGDLHELIPDPPFHTVLLDWDVVRSGDTVEDESLEGLSKRLIGALKDLMEILRGDEAAEMTPPPLLDQAARRDDLDRRNAAWWVDKGVQVFVFFGGISAIVFIVGIFVFISREGLGFVTDTMDVKEFFTSPRWNPTSDHRPTYGALALIAGTASVTGLAMLIAVPFSLGAAIFIAEFARGKTREVLKVLVELLAAIPSVVWGFIGLSIMNPLIIDTFEVPIGLNVLNAGIILGLMAAPIMTTLAEDALKAVPDGHREAAEALGATRWQVTRKVVIPAARNGLVAAVLLGVGRAFGETMAVLMASGHSINLPTSPFDSVRALTATIAAELGETVHGDDHYRALFTLGIGLFAVTFLINLAADLVVRGVRRK